MTVYFNSIWPSTFDLTRPGFLNFFFLDPWFGQGHRFGRGLGHGLGPGRISNFGLGFGHGHEIFKDFGYGLGHGLGQSHDFGHRHGLGNGHTSMQSKSSEPLKKVLTCAEMVLWKVYFYQKNDVWHLLIKVFLLSQLQLKLTLFFHVHPKRKFSNISILLNFRKFLIFWEMWTSTWTF